jgi:hypothetical protein
MGPWIAFGVWSSALCVCACACGGSGFSVEEASKNPLDAISVGDVEDGGPSEASVIFDSGSDVLHGEDGEGREAAIAEDAEGDEGGYVVGVVIPSTVSSSTEGHQGKCCIPDTVMPPPGQIACATVLCTANCIPLVCSICPILTSGLNSYTVVCPAP